MLDLERKKINSCRSAFMDHVGGDQSLFGHFQSGFPSFLWTPQFTRQYFSMAVLLLHTPVHGPLLSSRSQIDGMNILRPLIYEGSILSGHFRIHSKRRTTYRPQLLREAQKNLVNRPISRPREINPEHGQGQLARQKAQRCTCLFGGRVECQGKKIQWQNG